MSDSPAQPASHTALPVSHRTQHSSCSQPQPPAPLKRQGTCPRPLHRPETAQQAPASVRELPIDPANWNRDAAGSIADARGGCWPSLADGEDGACSLSLEPGAGGWGCEQLLCCVCGLLVVLSCEAGCAGESLMGSTFSSFDTMSSTIRPQSLNRSVSEAPGELRLYSSLLTMRTSGAIQPARIRPLL